MPDEASVTPPAPQSSGPPQPTEPPTRPSIGRRLLRIGVWGLVAGLLLLAGLVFVASRTVTLQWAAQKAVLFTDGKLKIEGISGSVFREISAESVQWQDDTIDVTVTSPRFSYQPLALLDGFARVDRISAANVEVVLPPPATGVARQPIRLPPAMAALLPIAIERVDVGRVVVRRAGSEPVTLHNIEAVFRHDGDRFNASLLNVDVIAGETKVGIRGEAAVLSRAPYATDGRFALHVPLPAQPLRVDVRINGPLEELAVRASTVFAGAPVDARTVLYALDPRPLRQVRLDLKDFDLARYDRSLPTTRLTVSFDAEVMPAWASERKPLLIGPLNLANALAGTIDQKRIPVAAAKAVVGYVDGRVEVQSLQASGPLGDVTGDGWFERGSFRVALASDKLRLQGIDSTLAPRILKAQLAVEPIRAGARPAAGAAPGAPAGLKLDLKASDAALAAEMKAVFADNRLNISQAQVRLKADRQAGAGQASFSGNVGVAAPWPVELSGDFRDFDPSQLVAMPPALLNGKWRIAGRAAGKDGGQFDAGVTLENSRFRNLPLAGALAAKLSIRNNRPHRLSDVGAALKWGTTTVDASGALGDAADALRLSVSVPKVSEVQDGYAGAVSASATLRGALLEPAVDASIDGKHLAVTVGDLRASVAAAALELKSARLQSGVLALQTRLTGVEVTRPSAAESGRLAQFSRVTAIVDGSYADHTADLEAIGKDQRLVLAAKGGIADGGIWRGKVHELAASHPLLKMPSDSQALPAAGKSGQDFQSLQVFALEAGAEGVSARDARFGFQGASLNVRVLDWHDSILALKADANGVAARWLGRFVDVQALYGPVYGAGDANVRNGVANGGTRVDTAPQDLRLGAAIDFKGNLADTSASDWSGTLVLKREVGDLRLASANSEAPVSAGLHTLNASANIKARVVTVVLNVDGENIGRISGEAQTTLQSQGGPVWRRSSLSRSPLGGRLELAMSSFRWISPLVGDSWRVDGALSARLTFAGTLTKPRADGVVTGSNLSAQEQTLGMRLRDGVLAAEFSGDRVDVKVLRFESGEGSVAISGLLRTPGNGRSEARVVIDRLPIPLGVGQRVVLSGSTTATLENRALSVSGRLVADEGVIELKSGNAPAVSGDVVIVDARGGEHQVRDAPSPQGADARARPAIRKTGAPASSDRLAPADAEAFRIDTDVEVDLGRYFRVFGSGLEANLHGAIRVRGTFPAAPRATGTVEIVNGTYQTYNRRLKIKRGRVIFNGPLDNPALDIVAIREHLKIEPGVEISGNAVAPVVRLISDPDVADAQKLSWLVLGTGLEDAQGAGQLLALQAAATAMFGNEDAKYALGLTEKPGIDVLSVREQASSTPTAGATTDSAQGAVVTVGKRLSSRLFVTYEQSLRGVWNILRLQYEITDRLSLSVQAGSDSATDLLWFFPFD